MRAPTSATRRPPVSDYQMSVRHAACAFAIAAPCVLSSGVGAPVALARGIDDTVRERGPAFAGGFVGSDAVRERGPAFAGGFVGSDAVREHGRRGTPGRAQAFAQRAT